MGNLQKTIRYFKRNGIVNTYYAVMERLFYKDVPFCAFKEAPYDGPLYDDIKFSILVPVYETHEKHLRDMIDSCLAQVYGNFELILADASKTSGPKQVIESYTDSRIVYVPVPENKGISENTNVAIDAATGDYCALLDHDDLLTPDALYEMAVKLSMARVKGITVNMIYSDEDKCDGEATKFFGPHYKQKLNLDLLLSNNYICHFTVIRSEVIKALKFRGEYNGSQDYDMFLRVVGCSEPENILYINKILYHWRCHEESTAFNPASKEYAYDAGRRAIEDFVKAKYSANLPVSELKHKGFYKVEWGNVFAVRKDVGATGTVLLHKGKVSSGILDEEGHEYFKGMNRHFSGYMHRVDLQQEVYALDIRAVTPAPEMEEAYNELVNSLNVFIKEHSLNGAGNRNEIDECAKALGLKFGDMLAEKNLKLLYLPGGVNV